MPYWILNAVFVPLYVEDFDESNLWYGQVVDGQDVDGTHNSVLSFFR